MKPAHFITIALVAISGLTLYQARATKETPPSKEAPPTTQKNSPEQRPLAAARNISVILPRAPRVSPPQPSGSGVWVGSPAIALTSGNIEAAGIQYLHTNLFLSLNFAMTGVTNTSSSPRSSVRGGEGSGNGSAAARR